MYKPKSIYKKIQHKTDAGKSKTHDAHFIDNILALTVLFFFSNHKIKYL